MCPIGFEPRSRGFPGGFRPGVDAGYLEQQEVRSPVYGASRRWALAEVGELPDRNPWLKPNTEKPRERGWKTLGDPAHPASTPGLNPSGKPRKRGSKPIS
jgi:hypothetical protein